MAVFELDTNQINRLATAMDNYAGHAGTIVNDVLHNEGGQLIHDEIKRLMPVSGKNWKGKAKAASKANSLQIDNGELSVTVRSESKYSYLYFPDDGSNTRRHVGNQQFFRRGGENQTEEIIDRCVGRLVSDFEKSL